ncbi:unnamed protein product [Vitrella brassicaformis CCMP3155]|uniref:Uncharacterized protein n=1 Tax=Vitrella brassicaformis (strain CCMP3155) TaxID=1169540 RepID=A0A0G4FUS9_VITBC|nr:unnamed protein product [Vitrella brassicaformis CCMP3155]|eukprot:CEM18706.1 unnamed protein product [Vitrella brassicaformis CCMP3155]
MLDTLRRVVIHADGHSNTNAAGKSSLRRRPPEQGEDMPMGDIMVLEYSPQREKLAAPLGPSVVLILKATQGRLLQRSIKGSITAAEAIRHTISSSDSSIGRQQKAAATAAIPPPDRQRAREGTDDEGGTASTTSRAALGKRVSSLLATAFEVMVVEKVLCSSRMVSEDHTNEGLAAQLPCVVLTMPVRGTEDDGLRGTGRGPPDEEGATHRTAPYGVLARKLLQCLEAQRLRDLVIGFKALLHEPADVTATLISSIKDMGASSLSSFVPLWFECIKGHALLLPPPTPTPPPKQCLILPPPR